jgi:hypothetical protein
MSTLLAKWPRSPNLARDSGALSPRAEFRCLGRTSGVPPGRFCRTASCVRTDGALRVVGGVVYKELRSMRNS